jgi:hypothetical protein
MQCRKLAKTVDKLAGTLENLQKPIGPKGSCSKEDQEARKLELDKTQEMLKEAQKAHDKAVAKTYKVLRNLLSGDRQSWEWVCRKMHEYGLWSGVNGQMTIGRRPCLWAAFRDLLKLYKLTVFTAEAAIRQWLHIDQAVRKPQRATVLQLILQMEVLNDFVRYLLTLKDSPKAVPMTKKGNIPFGKADLAAIVLSLVPVTWQNKYNLTNLPDLLVPCY